MPSALSLLSASVALDSLRRLLRPYRFYTVLLCRYKGLYCCAQPPGAWLSRTGVHVYSGGVQHLALQAFGVARRRLLQLAVLLGYALVALAAPASQLRKR